MRPLIVISFLFIGLSFSCQKAPSSQQLNRVETLLGTHPDSALNVLNSLDPRELRTEESRAQYALLKSLALDKNYIDIQSDSLIRIAVDYYSRKRCSRERMLAYYSQGIVQKNAGEYIPSMIAFEKAESDALELKDYLYLGLIYKNKAFLYSFTNNNPASIECQSEAVRFFEKAEAPLYEIYAKASLAFDYSNNKEFKKADSLLLEVQKGTTSPSLLAQCEIRRAGILVKQDTLPQEAIQLFRHCPRSLFGFLDYAYLAQAFEMTGQRDSADYWMSEGYAKCQDKEQAATLDYMASRLKQNRGDYRTAFNLVDHAASVQDSLTRVLLQQSLSAAQRDYYKNEALLREERIRRMRERVIWGAVLGILALLLIIVTAILQTMKKDRLLREQIARLSLKEKSLEQVKKENALLVGSLFNEKIGRLKELSDSYFQEEDEKQKEIIFRQIRQTAASMRKDPNLFPSLEKDLDRYCNGVMSKLREQVPSIKSETNLHTIMLFFAGFSYPVVQFILNKVSIESLRTARFRFKKEILSAKAADAEMFLNLLEVKKRPQADTNESV